MGAAPIFTSSFCGPWRLLLFYGVLQYVDKFVKFYAAFLSILLYFPKGSPLAWIFKTSSNANSLLLPQEFLERNETHDGTKLLDGGWEQRGWECEGPLWVSVLGTPGIQRTGAGGGGRQARGSAYFQEASSSVMEFAVGVFEQECWSESLSGPGKNSYGCFFLIVNLDPKTRVRRKRSHRQTAPLERTSALLPLHFFVPHQHAFQRWPCLGVISVHPSSPMRLNF